MRPVLGVLALTVVLPGSVLAQASDPDAPVAAPGRPGYLADARNGCRVWDPSPAADEQVLWTGKCDAGIATGQGTVVWTVDGKVAETSRGLFRAGKLNGPGVVVQSDGSSYAGDWRDGTQTGTGMEIKANGETYEGAWAGGVYSGRGTYAFANGDRYEGDWLDGLRQGQGTYSFASGDRYEGGFRADQPDGPGVLTRKSGGVLQGDWRAGCLVRGAEVFAMNGDDAKCRADASSSPGAQGQAGALRMPGKPAPDLVSPAAPQGSASAKSRL